MTTVATLDGVTYIDDSKATNVGAALASIAAVAGPLVLIAGGDAKGADLTPLATALAGRLRAALLIGRDANQLERVLAGCGTVRRVADLAAAVSEARRLAERGDTVLLAPACASTDMFADYRARGDAFARAVRELAS